MEKIPGRKFYLFPGNTGPNQYSFETHQALIYIYRYMKKP
jgi:hypothetical protein